MRYMFTNAPTDTISELPEPFKTAIMTSRLWKWERSQGLETTGCLASLSIKIALTIPSRFTQYHWEMTGCKTPSTQKTPETVAQARLLGPSIHAVVGMVTYRIPFDMHMTGAMDAQVPLCVQKLF